jgi:hypothetical protein
MTTLHARFPTQHLLITELDYWSAGLSHQWWWGSSSDPLGAGRSAVASYYQSAIFSYPYSGGGTFWWYAVEEATPGTALWSTFQTLHQSI